MKHNAAYLSLFIALLAAGCGTGPSRSSGGFLGQVSRNPAEHVGQLVASFGSVASVRQSEGMTIFRVATPNRAYVFEISYPGEVPKLETGEEAHFLGRVTGAIDSVNVYYGKIVTVEGIAVQLSGQRAVYRLDQQDLAKSWLRKKLDLSEGGWPPAAAPRTIAAAAPMPQVAASELGPQGPATDVHSTGGDESAFKALLKSWNASSGEAKAKLRDFLAKWNELPAGDKELFLKWNGLSEEDKTLFLQLVTDNGAR